MTIQAIRETISALNYARHDRTGGTPEENQRINLPAELAPLMAKVSALQIPPRFAREIEDKKHALESAEKVIARWHENREASK